MKRFDTKFRLDEKSPDEMCGDEEGERGGHQCLFENFVLRPTSQISCFSQHLLDIFCVLPQGNHSLFLVWFPFLPG